MDNGRNPAFMATLVASQALAIAMVVLVILWTYETLGGYAWDRSAKEFNLHPLCMVCGFILLYGEAALSFRVFISHDKTLVKVIHGSFHLLAFVAAVVGLQAVFEFHNHSKINNMYSLHSWCGIATIVLFSTQYLFGFLTFFFPGMSLSLRQSYMPIHRFFGLGILFLAAVAAVSGINEKLFFKFKSGTSKYANLPQGAILGNCLGIIIVAYIMVVGFIVHNPNWQRKEPPETPATPGEVKPIMTHGETTDEE